MTLQQKFDPLVPFVHLHIEEATPIQDAHNERAVVNVTTMYIQVNW